MRALHPVLCEGRELRYVPLSLLASKTVEFINNPGKRLLKNLVIDGKTVVVNFRQMLRKLREDFVSEVIFTVETNIFRVLAGVGSISENVRILRQDVKEVHENVKEVGE